ncbi:MAG: hypothetical protein Wins2KO_04100 [Winogradskyella sp.]
MNNSLDTLESILEAVKKQNPNSEPKAHKIIENDLSILKSLDTYTMYYGVLTNGDNENAQLLDRNNNVIIQIGKNSQIIDFFHALKFTDASDAEISNPKGHFRGYAITVKGWQY